jgi:Asp-tRNA(Asn)/Glu-tRNA(Gln) amidotransferase A subunit family amidase
MPHRLTLLQMREMIRTRSLSAAELMEAHLQQIRSVNPRLNAFVSVLEESAMESAREADEKSGEQPPLHGIPVTIKDSFDMAGLPTYCGSALRTWHRAAADATAVRKLRAAGAIPIGKTNCPEFLMAYETDNRITGRTNNPWDPNRTAGGSSGGEAAAIAAFCSAGGVGSDGGGSIREPAHFCGIAGLKPTPGRVSAAGHVPEICHPGGLLGVAGPMARTARDVRALFEIIAGYDENDPFSAPVPLQFGDVEGIRVGVLEKWMNVPVQAPIRTAVRQAAALLRDLGFAVEPFELQEMNEAAGLWWFFFGEIAAPLIRALTDGKDNESHWTSTELIAAVPRTRHITGVEVVDKLALRDRLRSELLAQMDRCHVLLLPACGITAFPHRTRTWSTDEGNIGLLDAMAPLTPSNLLGMPAMVIPMALDPDGMPVGVQLVGKPFQEEVLLELAARIEDARGVFPSPRF